MIITLFKSVEYDGMGAIVEVELEIIDGAATVPEGTYLISDSPFIIPRGVTLQGERKMSEIELTDEERREQEIRLQKAQASYLHCSDEVAELNILLVDVREMLKKFPDDIAFKRQELETRLAQSRVREESARRLKIYHTQNAVNCGFFSKGII